MSSVIVAVFVSLKSHLVETANDQKKDSFKEEKMVSTCSNSPCWLCRYHQATQFVGGLK